jgi:hypothetical protein
MDRSHGAVNNKSWCWLGRPNFQAPSLLSYYRQAHGQNALLFLMRLLVLYICTSVSALVTTGFIQIGFFSFPQSVWIEAAVQSTKRVGAGYEGHTLVHLHNCTMREKLMVKMDYFFKCYQCLQSPTLSFLVFCDSVTSAICGSK